MRRRVVSLRARAGAAPGARRGLALMLVLIALSVGTVVTAATLTARSMSPFVAENAHDTASARWSSESAANYAVAMLQTRVDWEALAGDLLTGMPIAGGNATVTITNMAGDPPTSDDRDIIITAISTVDGIESTCQKLVRITPPVTSLEEVLDPYMGEVAAYGTDKIVIQDGAMMRPWDASGEGAAVNVSMATAAASAADVSIDKAISGSTVYFDESAAMTAPDMLPPGQAYTELPLDLPKLDLPWPGWSISQYDWANKVFTTGTTNMADDTSYGMVEIRAGAQVVLSDDVNGRYAFSRFTISDFGTLVIDGNVTMIMGLGGTLTLEQQGEIVFTDGSTLTLWPEGNDVFLHGKAGWIVGATGDPDTDPSMYCNPRNFLVCTDRWLTDIHIEDGACVCAEFHITRGRVTLHSGARLYGRVSAGTFTMEPGSRLFYDPRLDSRQGLLNLNGPLYDEYGEPIPGLEDAINTYSGSAEDFAPTIVQACEDAAGAEMGGEVLPPEPGGASPRNPEQAVATPIPTGALAFEDGSMFNGAVAYDDSDDNGVTMEDLGRTGEGTEELPEGVQGVQGAGAMSKSEGAQTEIPGPK